MPTAEFDLPAGHADVPPVPRTDFPEKGRPEGRRPGRGRGSGLDSTVSTSRRTSRSPIRASRRRSAASVDAMAPGRFFVEWAEESEPGTLSMERESGRHDGVAARQAGRQRVHHHRRHGINLASMRLARNNGGQAEPEIVAPGHDALLVPAGRRADEDQAGRGRTSTTTRTCRGSRTSRRRSRRARSGSSASAPAGNFGTLDPIEAFADLAWRKGLYLHVDGAFGGFILPFMRDLGLRDPAVRPVAQGRQLDHDRRPQAGAAANRDGLLPRPRLALFESIPTERTLIHTTSSTKPGSRAAGAWATFRNLGREGYRQSTAHVLKLRDIIADGVTAIPGMCAGRAPLHQRCRLHLEDDQPRGRPQPHGRGRLGPGLRHDPGKPFIRLSIHPSRDEEHAHGFVKAFEAGVAHARRA